MNRKTWLSAISLTLAIAMVAGLLAVLAKGNFSWGPPEVPKAQCEALTALTSSPAMKVASSLVYRERVANAIVREPQNTWSNLAFVFVGALIWMHDRRTFARLLGAAMIALGLASGLYHASLLPSWRTVDVATMGWVSFALCCHGYSSARRGHAIGTASELWIGATGGVLAMTAAFLRNNVRIAGVKPFDTTYTTIAGIGGIFALAVVGIVRAIRMHPQVRLPVARLAVLGLVVALAVFCQLNDRAGRCLCAPEGIVQAHALWHVLMAYAVGLAYDLFALIEGRSRLGHLTST
ncbi:MAG: ceramidase domain-containing protein [Lacunisphaera sp.]